MARQLLLVATDRGLTCFFREGRKSGERMEFHPDEAGIAAFDALLAASPQVPVRIAFDSVEEEFHCDTMPRVFGSARQQLLQRRQQQAFLNPAYSVAVPQGRSAATKGFDQVLLAALTDNDLLEPWLRVIADRAVPLAGIYSASLLSRHLFRSLNITDRYSLLLFRQTLGKLRQCYFLDGKFRVGRLTRILEGDAGSLRERYLKEADATRQFLASAKLMPRAETLHVHILHRPELADGLQSALAEVPDIAVHLHDLSALSKKLGSRGVPVDPNDPAALVAELLARADRRDGDFSPPQRRAEHRVYQARRALYGLSATAGIAALCLSLWQLGQGMTLSRDLAALDAQNRQAAALLVRTHDEQTASPLAAADIKAVVEAGEQLADDQRMPQPSLQLLGRALTRYDDIDVLELAWRTKPWTGDLVEGLPTPGQAQLDMVPRYGDEGLGQPVTRGAAWLQVKGEFTDFDGDYRAAHRRLETLLDELRATAGVASVSVTTTPLNIDSRQPLVARLGTLLGGDQKPRAPFEFTLALEQS